MKPGDIPSLCTEQLMAAGRRAVAVATRLLAGQSSVVKVRLAGK